MTKENVFLDKIDSKNKLIESLNSIDVRQLYFQNTRDSLEQRIFTYFLLSLHHLIIKNYPLYVIHRDRPDFNISNKIGVEITQLIIPDLEKFLSERKKQNVHGIYSPSAYKINKTLSNKEMQNHIELAKREELPYGFISGDDAEKETAAELEKRILKKCVKSKNYKKYEQNYLVINDLLNSSKYKLIEKYFNSEKVLYIAKEYFEKIFSCRGDKIYEISCIPFKKHNLVFTKKENS